MTRLHSLIPQGHLLLDLAALLLGPRERLDVVFAHVVEQLSGDFVKDGCSKPLRIALVVLKRHKLDDVCLHVLAIETRVERLFVAIKDVHCVKVGVAHPHDDDAHWEGGASHDLIDCLLEVANDAISDDQKNIESLIGLADVHLLCHAVEFF